MTIAMGFVCNDGIVLSADSQITTSLTKSHEAKIQHFDFKGGKAAFVYAGNVNFSLSAYQKVKKELIQEPPQDPLAKIESILEREYRRNVLKHPGHSADDSLDYQFLIAFWKDGIARLFMSDRTTLVEVDHWEPIGIGYYLAKHLIQSHTGGNIADVIKLSTYNRVPIHLFLPPACLCRILSDL